MQKPTSSKTRKPKQSKPQVINAKNINPQAIKKIYSSNFASNPSNFDWPPSSTISALHNQYGFLGLLTDGFSSTGTNTLEILSPDDFDLSLTQENGFTVFFWSLFSKQPNNLTRFILKKGNSVDELTPCIGLLPNNTNLFAKIVSSRQKVETLISNKKVESNRIYSIALTVLIDANEDLTEMSLYIDGSLDSQISIPGIPLHNQGSVWIGKPDTTTHGFVGTIAEIMLAPICIEENEISDINNECIECLMKSKGQTFNTAIIFENRFQRKVLMEKYLKYTGTSPLIVENLQLSNHELKEIVKKYDEDERKNEQIDEAKEDEEKEKGKEDEEFNKVKDKLEKILTSEEQVDIIEKLFLNAKFIYTVLFLANHGQEVIEVKRIIDMFQILKENLLFEFDYDFIVKLAKSFNAHCKENKVDYINLPVFFKMLKLIHVVDNEEGMNISTVNESMTNGQKDNNIFMNNSQNGINGLDKTQTQLGETFKPGFLIKSLYENKKKLEQIDENNKEDIVNQEVIENTQKEEKKEEAKNANDNKSEKENSDDNQNSHSKSNSNIDNEDEKVFMTGTKFAQNENKLPEDRDNNNTSKESQKKIEEEKESQSQSNINNIVGENEKVDNQNQNSKEPPNYYDPEYPDTWADGAFEVIINHCYNCHLHSTTTRHKEFTFVEKFNKIATDIKSMFPNAIIKGNFDDLEYYGSFDVYVRGLGPVFDEKSRYFLYIKKKNSQFPSSEEIVDKLVALAMVYGSSLNLESAQHQFLKENKNVKPSKFCHDYPCELSIEAERIRDATLKPKTLMPKIDEQLTKFYCMNWGCGKVFVQADNKKPNVCCYHPGAWQFGSYNGYWPECWSCCEGEWGSEGCTIGYHKGILLSERVLLCLNHGMQNPNTNHPDSACGKYYTKEDKSGCAYHKGYIKNGIFTCCGGIKNSEGCTIGNHATFEYPDIKAKLYFYPKAINNPGITDRKKKDMQTVGNLICKCDYFKKIDVVFTSSKTKFELLKTKREKELNEPRYCMNWGCESVFTEKEYETGEVLNCQCHPGKWDHGCTGTKLVDYVNELESNEKTKVILWKPHWTCCNKEWKEPGCRFTRHHGPLISSLGQNYHRFPWPSERLKLSFTKVISDRWRATLEKYTYDEMKVRSICNKYFDEKGGNVTNEDLPKLCDLLKLYLLVVNDKVDYSMKFNDIVSCSGSIIYFSTSIGKNGIVTKEKFVKWWFMPYEKILDVTNPKDKAVNLYNTIKGKKDADN